LEALEPRQQKNLGLNATPAVNKGGIVHPTGRPMCALLLSVLLAQTSLSGSPQAAPPTPAAPPVSNKFVLDDGTPIKLR